MRLGFSDDGGRAADSPQRIAYDLVAEAFGPGLNGPFLVAVQTDEPGDQEAVDELVAALSADPGVAVAVAAPISRGLQSSPPIQVVPTTSPQDEATAELLRSDAHRRDPARSSRRPGLHGPRRRHPGDHRGLHRRCSPPRCRCSSLVVVGFGFLVLVLLFRSILVPLTGVITSLLSLGAAWGHGRGLPVGLACRSGRRVQHRADHAVPADHGVRDPVRPVDGLPRVPGQPDAGGVAAHRGQRAGGATRTGRLRARWSPWPPRSWSASSVRSCWAVDPTIKLFGLSLATAVLFDAFIVRLIIVPVRHVPVGQRELVAARAGWIGSCPTSPSRRRRTSPSRTPRSRTCPWRWLRGTASCTRLSPRTAPHPRGPRADLRPAPSLRRGP